MSLFGKIFATFIEGWKKRKAILYQSDYEAIKNGEGHSIPHPEIETDFHIVKETIESPHQVNQNAENNNKECYYKWFSGTGNYQNCHMKVIMKVTRNGKMIVVSTYFTKYITSDEKLLWSYNQ